MRRPGWLARETTRMSWFRPWFIRAGILTALAALVWAGLWAYNWVSPEKVRAAVVENLQRQFDDTVEVEVGSAHVRFFGGLSVQNLKLTRRGETEPFLHVPSAVITHDKERLNRGELVIRKIELDSPTVRLVRGPDGRWNIAGITKPGSVDKPIPTILIKGGTVFIEDRGPAAFPALAIRNVKLNILGDSPPWLKVDGQAQVGIGSDPSPDPTALSIPVAVSGKWNRDTNQSQGRVDISDLEIGPDFAGVVARLHPAAAEYFQRIHAKTGIRAEFSLPGSTAAAPSYDVKFDVREGRYDHEDLPWPIDRFAGSLRLRDGRVTVEKATARLGKSAIDVSLETRAGGLTLGGTPDAPLRGPRVRPPVLSHLLKPPGPAVPPVADGDDPFLALEEKLEKLDLTVHSLTLDDELFRRLTPKAAVIQRMFSPDGGVDIAVRFTRPDYGWRREIEIRPNKLGIRYEKFRYPISDLSGTLKKVVASDGTDEFQIAVVGTAGGRSVSMTGKVAGEGKDPFISLKIAGNDIPIDDRLFVALPGKYPVSLGKLRGQARGDFKIDIHQAYGVNRCENTFSVKVFDGTVNYAHFPYPVKQVRGNVLVHVSASDPERPLRPGLAIVPEENTDRVELRNFEAVHDGGRFWISGDNEAVPGTADRKLTLRLQGENCPIDADFNAALREMKLDGVTRTFNPRGDLTFGADVEIWDRSGRTTPADQLPDPASSIAALGGVAPVVALFPAEPPFNPTTDMRLSLHFKGPSVTPTFFPYDLHNLAGLLRYHGGRVELVKFSAKHGASELKLDAGDIRFADSGEVWANLGGIGLNPMVPDEALLKAMPEKIRHAFRELKFRGSADLFVKHLVVSIPGDEKSKDRVVRGQAPGENPPELKPPVWTPRDASRPYSPVAAAEPVAMTVPTAAPISTSGGVLPFTLPWHKNPPPPVAPKVLPTPKRDETRDPVIYWNASLKLNGSSMEAGLPFDELFGTIASEGRYEGTHVGAVVGNIWLDKALVGKQPLSSAKLAYRIRAQTPDATTATGYAAPAIEFPDITATLFQGTVGGQARVILDEQVKYRVWLTATGVRLDELARHTKLGSDSELRGLAQGSFLVENAPDPKTGTWIATGHGQIDVPQGRMYKIPVLLDLVKVLKGQTPDRCAFEEAHATLELKGDLVKVTQLDLLGSAISLGGSGELDTEGQHVKFEFYTIWSQTLKRWLTTPLGDVTGLLSGSLFKIELTREGGKLTSKAVMLPVVTDPVRAVAERLRNRWDKPGEAPPTVRATMGR